MFLQAPPESAASARLLGNDLRTTGYVMNLTRLWAWRPDLCEDFAGLRATLTATSALAPRELGVLACAMAASRGAPYCALAWGGRLAAAAGETLAAAVLHGTRCETMTVREEALAAWARKVAQAPNATTAADVDRLRAAGLAERDIFEATAFVAFRLAFSTINAALGAQPDWQLVATVPRSVRAAVAMERAQPPSGPA